MSTLLHPKGSEPPEVYWRRRVLVIVLAVLLVLLVAWLAWPKASSSAAPTPQQSVAVPTQPATSAPPAASGSPSASTSAGSAAPVVCDPGSLGLDLAGYQKVKQGSKQVFRVSIKNTADPCVLQVNASNFDLTVKSGTDRIWTTGDCAKWVPNTKATTLKQNQSTPFDVTWGLVRSKANCGTTKDVLKPGTYVATATFGKRVNAIQVFTITKAG